MKYRGRSIIKSNMKLTANNSILPFISPFLLYSSMMEKIHLTSETRRNVNNTMLRIESTNWFLLSIVAIIINTIRE
jgi:hypothetical protein